MLEEFKLSDDSNTFDLADPNSFDRSTASDLEFEKGQTASDYFKKFSSPRLQSEPIDSYQNTLVIFPDEETLIAKRQRKNEIDSTFVSRLNLDLTGLGEQYQELYDILVNNYSYFKNRLPDFGEREIWINKDIESLTKTFPYTSDFPTSKIFTRLSMLSDAAYQIKQALDILRQRSAESETGESRQAA
jgi:hypothetical protein